jgi:predicted nucleic acid-binding protein
MYYLDTNIFIYATDPTNAYFKNAQKLITMAEKQSLQITTSVETLQEIIHFSQRLDKLNVGITLCEIIHTLIPKPFPIDSNTIKHYLNLIQQFPKLQSRDCLHIATCQQHQFSTLVTQDKHLLQTKIDHLAILPLESLPKLAVK